MALAGQLGRAVQRGLRSTNPKQRPDHPTPTVPNQGSSGKAGQTGGYLTPHGEDRIRTGLTQPRILRPWIEVQSSRQAP